MAEIIPTPRAGTRVSSPGPSTPADQPPAGVGTRVRLTHNPPPINAGSRVVMTFTPPPSRRGARGIGLVRGARG